MNERCTAHITARKSTADNTVSVHYCLGHTGHNMDIGHLKFTQDLRNSVVAKLFQGVKQIDILNAARKQFIRD